MKSLDNVAQDFVRLLDELKSAVEWAQVGLLGDSRDCQSCRLEGEKRLGKRIGGPAGIDTVRAAFILACGLGRPQ